MYTLDQRMDRLLLQLEVEKQPLNILFKRSLDPKSFVFTSKQRDLLRLMRTTSSQAVDITTVDHYPQVGRVALYPVPGHLPVERAFPYSHSLENEIKQVYLPTEVDRRYHITPQIISNEIVHFLKTYTGRGEASDVIPQVEGLIRQATQVTARNEKIHLLLEALMFHLGTHSVLPSRVEDKKDRQQLHNSVRIAWLNTDLHHSDILGVEIEKHWLRQPDGVIKVGPNILVRASLLPKKQ